MSLFEDYRLLISSEKLLLQCDLVLEFESFPSTLELQESLKPISPRN